MDEQKEEKEELPNLEDMFVVSVSSAIELALMLGMTKEQFLSTMKMAWVVDCDRRKKEELQKEKLK